MTVRTVRYYVQQGLLPSPVAAGPATRYGPGHLDRLRLIRKWQDEYLPLAVIRQRISDLSDEDVARLVAGRPAAPSPLADGPDKYDVPMFLRRGMGLDDALGSAATPESATPHDAGKAVLDYIRQLTGRGERETPTAPAATAPTPSPAPATAASFPTTPLKRATWEVVELAPDVQLQVRRPLTREANRRVERLIEAARKILGEG